MRALAVLLAGVIGVWASAPATAAEKRPARPLNTSVPNQSALILAACSAALLLAAPWLISMPVQLPTASPMAAS